MQAIQWRFQLLLSLSLSLSLSLPLSLSLVPAGSHLHVVGMLRFKSDINQLSLPTPFNNVLVSISVFMALLTVLHSINSPDNSPFSHSVLPVLFVFSTIYIFMKVSFSPDVIPNG